MPIITLQRRLVQQGTIRIGAQVATSGGKMRPSALDKFRFTSDRKDLLDRMAVMYGGTVRPFEEPKSTDTWELFSDADVIEVLVPPPGPGRSVVSQWYEKWSAGGCTHRCDGAVMLKCDGRDMPPDTPCQCDERGVDVTDDAHCDAHTRLSVVIPGTGAIGVWRLNSNGWNAAEEMAGIAAVILDRATSLGYSVPCTLSIQRREVKKLEDGKATTKKFVVPVLSPDVPEDVMRGIAGGMPYNPLAHTSGDPRDVRDALGAPAPAALPSGGVRADRYGTGRIKAQPVDVAVPATGMPLPGGPLKSNPKAGFAFINGLPGSFRGDEGKELRHALYALAAGRDGADFADLSGPQRAQVAKWASMIEAGTAQLVQNAGAYEILGNDADAVVVARHQGGLEKAP